MPLLTFDPWPTIISWVQAGGVWALHVFHLFACCSCICCGLEALSARSAVYFWLLIVWVIFWFTFPRGLLPLRLSSARLWAFLPSAYFFIPSVACYHFLSYHSAIPTAMLFDTILLGLFGPTFYPSPNDSTWSLVLFLHGLWAPVSHLLIGHP